RLRYPPRVRARTGESSRRGTCRSAARSAARDGPTALLAHLAVVKLAEAGERLDRVFCGVIVPGDVVVVHEGEEPALVLAEPLPVVLRQLGAAGAVSEVVEEAGDLGLVLVQMPLLEAVLVDRADDRPQQLAELRRDCLELVIEGAA